MNSFDARSRTDEAQRDDLAGEVLGVGEVALGALAILLDLHAVAVVLPVLREQDEGAAYDACSDSTSVSAVNPIAMESNRRARARTCSTPSSRSRTP